MPEDDFDAFSLDQPDQWPDDHYSGMARDLADRIDDTTLDALSHSFDTTADGPPDFDHVSFALWTMFMMHEDILFAATGTTAEGPTRDTIKGLADHLRVDDNYYDDCHLYFSIRLRQRLEEGG